MPIECELPPQLASLCFTNYLDGRVKLISRVRKVHMPPLCMSLEFGYTGLIQGRYP